MDVDAPIKKVGHLPPKKLALVAVVGIGAGFAWKHFAKGKTGGSVTTPASNDNVDLSQLALAGSSTGNLGVGGTSSGVGDSSGGTREVGSITLPVVKWVVTIGGKQFLTDGTNLEELGGGTVTQTPSTSSTDPNRTWWNPATQSYDHDFPGGGSAYVIDSDDSNGVAEPYDPMLHGAGDA